MKTTTYVVAAALVAIAGLTPTRTYAVAGVADSTIIIGDLTDEIKWPRELAQWESVIRNTANQIQKTDELIKLVGNPKAMMDQFVGAVPDLLQPLEDTISLETRQEALATANQLYHLKSVAVQTYKDANKVGDEYTTFLGPIKRDPARYAHYVLQEAMNARYKKAVENAEAVEKSETAVQKQALERLKTASTQMEVSMLNAVIAASKQRVDLAHAKAQQVKGELDAFRGQLVVEDQKKQEADREWAQGVVTDLRKRALDAYKAQFSGAD
jgi:hypothetical protein